MASTVHITLSDAMPRVASGAPAPISRSVHKGADTVTSGAASVQSSLTGKEGLVWTITNSGANVYVNFGSDPTAAADNGWLVLDGETREFVVSDNAELVAVIDA